MANSLTTSSPVFTGFWIDHDEGRFRGARLTLSSRDAAALLSFLAVAVTFSGNRSWKIWRFVFYQCLRRSSDGSQGSIRAIRQIKVILRNVVTAGSTVWTFVELLWSGRREQKAHIWNWKSISLIVFAALHLVTFLAAGILTSRILLGNLVVSRSTDTCGQWLSSNTDPDGLDVWQSLRQNETMATDNYVRECYTEGPSRGILDCGRLYTRSLPFQVHDDAPCPFQDDLCISTGYTMDSGRIPFSHLGINHKYSKSLHVQRQSTCAVIPDDPFFETVYTSDDLPLSLQGNDTIQTYSFFTDTEEGGNRSMPYRNDIFSATYSLKSLHLIFAPVNISEPIRPESPKDHDVSLVLLRSNGVKFRRESDDPWFSVHTRTAYDNSTGLISPDMVRYETDRFLNIIACDERVRLCSDLSDTCTSWGGLYDVLDNPVSTVASLASPAIANGTDEFLDFMKINMLLSLNLMYTSIPNAIQGREGASATQFSRYLNEGNQYYLEPEQWKVELNYWFQMALARLQLDLFNGIQAPPGLDLAQAVNVWDSAELRSMCGRIKFHSPVHSSLSVLGFAIVVAVVGLLIAGSCVDVVLGWVPAKWARAVVAEWERLENLNLLFELEAWWARGEEWADPFEERVVGK